MKKRIDDVIGMGDYIVSLSDDGLNPRQIRDKLKDKYSKNEIPSQTSIYNYLNKVSNIQLDESVKLTGNVQKDVELVLNSFDVLIDLIFSKYEITYQDRKLIAMDLNYFKATLRMFLEECLKYDTKLKDTLDYWVYFVTDEVILPAIEGYPEVAKKIVDAMEKVMKEPEKLDIEKMVSKYRQS